MKNKVIIVGAGSEEITHILAERFSKMNRGAEVVSVTEEVTNNHEVKNLLRSQILPHTPIYFDYQKIVTEKIFDKPKSKFHK